MYLLALGVHGKVLPAQTNPPQGTAEPLSQDYSLCENVFEKGQNTRQREEEGIKVV